MTKTLKTMVRRRKWGRKFMKTEEEGKMGTEEEVEFKGGIFKNWKNRSKKCEKKEGRKKSKRREKEREEKGKKEKEKGREGKKEKGGRKRRKTIQLVSSSSFFVLYKKWKEWDKKV